MGKQATFLEENAAYLVAALDRFTNVTIQQVDEIMALHRIAEANAKHAGYACCAYECSEPVYGKCDISGCPCNHAYYCADDLAYHIDEALGGCGAGPQQIREELKRRGLVL